MPDIREQKLFSICFLITFLFAHNSHELSPWRYLVTLSCQSPSCARWQVHSPGTGRVCGRNFHIIQLGNEHLWHACDIILQSSWTLSLHWCFSYRTNDFFLFTEAWNSPKSSATFSAFPSVFSSSPARSLLLAGETATRLLMRCFTSYFLESLGTFKQKKIHS